MNRIDRRLTDAQIDARMEAFEEAASHMEQSWSDDPEELRQGHVVAEFIRSAAEEWLRLLRERRAKQDALELRRSVR